MFVNLLGSSFSYEPPVSPCRMWIDIVTYCWLNIHCQPAMRARVYDGCNAEISVIPACGALARLQEFMHDISRTKRSFYNRKVLMRSMN